MLTRSDIHRSLSNMAINFQRAVTTRAHRGDLYSLAEREFQDQHEFSGQLGTLPVEASLALAFDLSFVADPGNQRDSSLDRPIFRSGFERSHGPAGAIPYATLDSWIKDDDFNFVGANLTIGVHYPALLADPTLTDLAFFFIVHLTFQGFCVVWDPEGPLDAGGNIDDQGAP